jgi:phage terminase large subunit-like protein
LTRPSGSSVDRSRDRLASLQAAADELYEIRREKARRDFAAGYAWLTAPLVDGRVRPDLGRTFAPFQAEGNAFADAHPYAINLWPRGHAKTTIRTVHRTAWEIGRDSALTNLLLSRAGPFAHRLSRRIKRLMRSPQYVELFGDIAPAAGTTKDTEGEWERRGSTADEPTVVAIGQGGQVPGNRALRIRGDDIINRRDVLTAAQRDKVYEWFLTEVLPVANDPASRVELVGTRYHQDDLYGRLSRTIDDDEDDAPDDHELAAVLEQERPWAVYTVGALGPDGEPAWPELWPAWGLHRRRTRLGTPICNLQYQNDPSGMGGNIIRRAWYRYAGGDNGQLVYDPRAMVRLRIGVDLASSEKQTNDQTAFALVADDARAAFLWILHVEGAWLAEGHRAWLLDRLATALNRLGLTGHPITAALVEAVQYQSTFARELLGATRLPVNPRNPKVDKVERARPLATRYEGGTVIHHPDLAGGAYEEQAVYFPNAEHDDLVDATVYAADLGDPLQIFA